MTTNRPPIGTICAILRPDSSIANVTIAPTGRSVPDGEVNVMHDGSGSIETVATNRLKVTPDAVRTTVATLRTAAEWLPGEQRDMLREVADQTEWDWDGACCPLCEEVTCDEGCPLGNLRAPEVLDHKTK